MDKKKVAKLLGSVKAVLVERGKKTSPVGHGTHEALLEEFVREILKRL